MNRSKGFTLIELLVVISIIGVVSSVVLVSLNSARLKSKDTTRKQTLTTLRSALELYNLQNSSYPIADSWMSSEPGDTFSNNGGDWIPGLATSGAIKSLPRDPKGGLSTISVCAADGSYRAYLYKSDGRDYKLLSYCTPEAGPNNNDGLVDPIRPGYSWAICSTPAVCNAW